MFGLTTTAYALGDIRETIYAWCESHQQTEGLADALRRNGSLNVWRSQETSQLDLASLAVSSLLKQADLKPSAIDLLIVCHTSPTNTLPAPLSFVGEIKHRIGANRALGFSIGQQQCVSSVHALYTANVLFQSRPEIHAAVILCADTLNREALRPIGDAGIQSDGASAIMLQRGRGSPVAAIHTYNHAKPTQGILPSGEYENDPNYLWALITLIRNIAKKTGIRPEDFTSILPHNVNLPAWNQALKALRIPPHKLFSANFPRTGHVFGSDIAINIADSDLLNTPGYHMVLTSGVGGAFGGFSLKCH